MTARTYLSIGDVLTLLREEFPDVTISKIRFLESQGLVNPERSPSGYRKFFETDVERLRWVLRQQREHFLPLKVIRDRLADGDLGEDEAAPSETATHGNGRAAQPVHAGAAAGVGARGGSGSGSSGGSGGSGRGPSGATGTVTAPPPPHEQSSEQSEADDQAMARILADANRRSTRVPEGADPLRSLHAIPDPSAPAPPAHTIAAGDESAGAVDTPPSAEAAGAAAPVSAPAVSTAPVPPVPPAAPAPAPAPADLAPAPADPAPAPTTVTPSTPTARAPRHAPAAASVAPPVSVPYPAPPGPGPGAGHEPAGHEQTASASEVGGAAGARGGAGGAGGTGRGSGSRAGTERQGATAARGAESGAAAPREKGAGGASGKSAGSQSAKNAGAVAAAAQAAQAPPAGAGGAAGAAAPPAAGAGATGAGGGAAGAGAAGAAAGVVTGASLTAEELCAASGLSEAELANLQGFGLIEPLMVAGIPTFDEDALTVANLAAAFRKFGIEARHLRPYRNAVDREVGLIEQVIIPLLRQRNPESRQRAVEAADELGALGQTMRATLMRAALRRHVGG